MTDLALGLRGHAYHAVSRARRRAGDRDDFRATLCGRPTVVLRSEAGVRCFYDTGLVARSGAVPGALAHLLFGRGAVRGLDDSVHRARKDLLRSLVEADAWTRLVEDAAADLEQRTRWRPEASPAVHADLVAAYGAAALDWAACARPAASGSGSPASCRASWRASEAGGRTTHGAGWPGGGPTDGSARVSTPCGASAGRRPTSRHWR